MRRADLIERLVWLLLLLAVCLVAAPGRAIAEAEASARLIPPETSVALIDLPHEKVAILLPDGSCRYVLYT